GGREAGGRETGARRTGEREARSGPRELAVLRTAEIRVLPVGLVPLLVGLGHAEVAGDVLVAHGADGLVARRAAGHGDVRAPPEGPGDRAGPAAVVEFAAGPAALQAARVVRRLAAHPEGAVARVPRVIALPLRDIRHVRAPSR